MANKEQLAILGQGVNIWNEWAGNEWQKRMGTDQRVEPFRADLSEVELYKFDLSGAILCAANLSWTKLNGMNLSGANLLGADLEGAELCGVNLSGAILNGANLYMASIEGADLSKSDLFEARLCEAHLSGANLCGARLNRADLRRADMSHARLCEAQLNAADMTGTRLCLAQLNEADLRGTRLIQSDFRRAIITGAKLYGSARDDWQIEGIICDYVFWDKGNLSFNTDKERHIWESEHRVPKDRDFRLGEFEELYKHLPTFEYYFQQGFTPIDAILMDQAVQTIDTRYPEFQLKLVSLDSRGQPHAVFTVQQPEQVETAQSQVTMHYERRILELEAQKTQLMDVVKMLGSSGIRLQAVTDGFNLRHLLSSDLTQHIVAFLVALPDIHDRLKQQALLISAGLDESLFNQLPIGAPPTAFISALVSRCVAYGQLRDKRHALIAVMNAAKQFVGADRQAAADALIEQIAAQAQRA